MFLARFFGETVKLLTGTPSRGLVPRDTRKEEFAHQQTVPYRNRRSGRREIR
jgi:hypothetical protein